MSEIQKSGTHLKLIMKETGTSLGGFYFASSKSLSKILIRSLRKKSQMEEIKQKGKNYVQDLSKPKYAYGLIRYKDNQLIFTIRKATVPLATLKRVCMKELSLHRPLKHLKKAIFQVDEASVSSQKKSRAPKNEIKKRKERKSKPKTLSKKQHKTNKKIILLEEDISLNPTQESWDRLHKLRLEYIQNVEETSNPFQNASLDRISSIALQVGASSAIHALQKQFMETTKKQIALVEELIDIESEERQALNKKERQQEYNTLYQQSQAFEEALKKMYTQIML